MKILLPITLLSVLLINFFAGKTSFEKAKDTSDHQLLANELIKTNQLDQAEREFVLTGADTTRIQEIRAEPDKIKAEILLWQKLTGEFPSFRDAYIKLAILNYKINRLFDAKKFLDQALAIDPNNEVAKKLSSLLP